MGEVIVKNSNFGGGTQREGNTVPDLSACLGNISLEQILPGINM